MFCHHVRPNRSKLNSWSWHPDPLQVFPNFSQCQPHPSVSQDKEFRVILTLLHLISKWSESHSVMSDSLRPHGLDSPWNSPGQNPFPSPRDLPNSGVKPRSPTLQVDSLPAEPQGNLLANPRIPPSKYSQNLMILTISIQLYWYNPLSLPSELLLIVSITPRLL